jgi:hypothetical protein
VTGIIVITGAPDEIYSMEIKNLHNGPEGYCALIFEYVVVYMDHDFILLLAKKIFYFPFQAIFILTKISWSICYEKSNYLKYLGFLFMFEKKTTASSYTLQCFS